MAGATLPPAVTQSETRSRLVGFHEYDGWIPAKCSLPWTPKVPRYVEHVPSKVSPSPPENGMVYFLSVNVLILPEVPLVQAALPDSPTMHMSDVGKEQTSPRRTVEREIRVKKVQTGILLHSNFSPYFPTAAQGLVKIPCRVKARGRNQGRRLGSDGAYEHGGSGRKEAQGRLLNMSHVVPAFSELKTAFWRDGGWRPEVRQKSQRR